MEAETAHTELTLVLSVGQETWLPKEVSGGFFYLLFSVVPDIAQVAAHLDN